MNTPKKRRGRITPAPSSPLLQIMPGRRVRVDPSLVEQMGTWLLACALPWERASERSLVGLNSGELEAARGHKQWCRHAVGATQVLIGRLLDTLALDDIDNACDLIRAEMARVPVPRDLIRAEELGDNPLTARG